MKKTKKQDMYNSEYLSKLAQNSIFALRKTFKCISIKKKRAEQNQLRAKQKFTNSLINFSLNQNQYLQSIKKSIVFNMKALKQIQNQKQYLISQIRQNPLQTQQNQKNDFLKQNHEYHQECLFHSPQLKVPFAKTTQSILSKTYSSQNSKQISKKAFLSQTNKKITQSLKRNVKSKTWHSEVKINTNKNIKIDKKEKVLQNLQKEFKKKDKQICQKREIEQKNNLKRDISIKSVNKNIRRLKFIQNVTSNQIFKKKQKKCFSQIKCEATSFPSEDRGQFICKFSMLKNNFSYPQKRLDNDNQKDKNKQIKVKTQPMKFISGWQNKNTQFQVFEDFT